MAFGFYSNLVILLFSSVMLLFGTWPGLRIALRETSQLSVPSTMFGSNERAV